MNTNSRRRPATLMSHEGLLTKKHGAESDSSIQVFTPPTCISSDDQARKGSCKRKRNVVDSIAAMRKGVSENLGKLINGGSQMYEVQSKKDGYQSDDEQTKDKDDCSSIESSSSFSDDGSLIYHLTHDKAGHKVIYIDNFQMLYENAPPPNPLLPKKALPQEPTKSGFALPFVCDQKLPEVGENSSPAIQALPVPRSVQLSYQALLQQEGTPDDYQAKFTESTLKHFFYMEYRKTQPGEKNPIVYSRFGKQSYESEDKFDTENFNHLIRTCNLKKLLRGQPGDDPPIENKTSQPYYVPKEQSDKTLVFESRFESGNLLLAHKQSEAEYNLILQTDINSKGHTQWFYYRVTNCKKGQKVKFNLLNFVKSKSLFNEGMKVLMYSQKDNESKQVKWYRGGEDLVYYQNNYRRESMTQSQRYYYTFTFTHTFLHDDDVIYFAYSQPYTYTDLVDYLTGIEKMNFDYVRRNTLCKTLAGNKCEYLTITSKTNDEDEQKQKKGVIISGRVHPGESNASWMMKGTIDYLISDQARDLRKQFIFKIIPMINPDGVINGNYRCSLAGCDLNRRYKTPSQILHPTVWHLKRLAKEFSLQRQLVLFCDLHGHSRRKNVFMYGNVDPANDETTRLFPFIMSKVCDPHFSFDYCRFKVQKSKESSARIALWKDLRVHNVFTMEASFCGARKINDEQPYHFVTEDLERIGAGLLKSLDIYDSQKGMIDEYRKHTSIEDKTEIQVEEMKQLIQEFDSKIKEEKASTIQEETNESSSGSDSEGSEDNLEAEELAKLLPKKAQKKRTKKKKTAAQEQNKPPIRKIITEELTKEEKKELPVQTEVKKKTVTQRNQYDFKKPTESYLSRFNMLNKIVNKKKISRDAYTQTTPGKEEGDIASIVQLKRQNTFSPLHHRQNDSISSAYEQEKVTVLYSKKCQDYVATSGEKYSSTKKPQLSARINGSGLKPKETSQEKTQIIPFRAAFVDQTNMRAEVSRQSKQSLVSMEIVKTFDEISLRQKPQISKFQTENQQSIISNRVIEQPKMISLQQNQNKSGIVLPNRQHLIPLVSAPIPYKRRITQGANRKRLDQIDENSAPPAIARIRSVSTANNNNSIAIQRTRPKLVRVGAVGGGAKAMRRGEQSDDGITAIIKKTAKKQINQSNV